MTVDEIKSRVADATVQLTKKGGLGVLVPGGFILTAAHCITWSHEGEMALGEYFIENIETASGKSLRVQPLALEPVSDMAILGNLDNQEFFDEVMAFEKFCEAVPSVPVCSKEFCPDELPERPEAFPVWIRTHKRTWLRAQATQWVPRATILCLELEEEIEGGTSGGPAINDRGQLVGIVSIGGSIHSQEGEDLKDYSGQIVRPHRTLPVWAWNSISEAMQEDES